MSPLQALCVASPSASLYTLTRARALPLIPPPPLTHDLSCSLARARACSLSRLHARSLCTRRSRVSAGQASAARHSACGKDGGGETTHEFQLPLRRQGVSLQSCCQKPVYLALSLSLSLESSLSRARALRLSECGHTHLSGMGKWTQTSHRPCVCVGPHAHVLIRTESVLCTWVYVGRRGARVGVG